MDGCEKLVDTYFELRGLERKRKPGQAASRRKGRMDTERGIEGKMTQAYCSSI